MRNIFFIVIVFSILFTNSCKKNNDDIPCYKEDPNIEEESPIEEDPCIKEVDLERIFTVQVNCIYTFIDTNYDTLKLSLTDINDLRAYGAGGCASSTGGNAEIYFNVNGSDFMFNWRGCDGVFEHNLDNPNLPSYQIDSFQIKMAKMYPLSEILDGPPESIEDYYIRLGILKN